MEETQERFTPEQSLELIGKFILNYRKNLKEHSFSFLMWGWLTIIASISHFIILTVLLERKEFQSIGVFSAINWITFLVVGILLTMFHFRRQHSIQPETRSHISHFIATLWQVTAAAIIVEVFICFKMGINFPSPLILATLGLATVVTGAVIKFKPIVYGGVILFIFAFSESFIMNQYQLLFNAIAFLFGYIVPGYLLKTSKSV